MNVIISTQFLSRIIKYTSRTDGQFFFYKCLGLKPNKVEAVTMLRYKLADNTRYKQKKIKFSTAFQ